MVPKEVEVPWNPFGTQHSLMLHGLGWAADLHQWLSKEEAGIPRRAKWRGLPFLLPVALWEFCEDMCLKTWTRQRNKRTKNEQEPTPKTPDNWVSHTNPGASWSRITHFLQDWGAVTYSQILIHKLKTQDSGGRDPQKAHLEDPNLQLRIHQPSLSKWSLVPTLCPALDSKIRQPFLQLCSHTPHHLLVFKSFYQNATAPNPYHF